MKTELLTPAALLAQVALTNWQERYGELSQEVMTDAFLKAYNSLEKAQQKHAQLKESLSSLAASVAS